MRRLRAKLTYSNVISTLCLVLLLGGGTAYAAKSLLPKNSVGAKQIKKGAITPSKLAPAATAALKGATGAVGPQGPTGALGPSEAFFGAHDEEISIAGHGQTTPLRVATLALPAGSYAIEAKLNSAQASAKSNFMVCTMSAGGESDLSVVPLGDEVPANDGEGTMAFQLDQTFSAAGAVTIECGVEKPEIPEIVNEIHITAIKVGTLHQQGL